MRRTTISHFSFLISHSSESFHPQSVGEAPRGSPVQYVSTQKVVLLFRSTTFSRSHVFVFLTKWNRPWPCFRDGRSSCHAPAFISATMEVMRRYSPSIRRGLRAFWYRADGHDPSGFCVEHQYRDVRDGSQPVTSIPLSFRKFVISPMRVSYASRKVSIFITASYILFMIVSFLHSAVARGNNLKLEVLHSFQVILTGLKVFPSSSFLIPLYPSVFSLSIVHAHRLYLWYFSFKICLFSGTFMLTSKGEACGI